MKSQKSKVKSQKFTKQRIPVVMLGEKDHGKSTLLGRLLYETGSIAQDRRAEIQRAVKKSGRKFEWAHLLDSFRYEREHEMTLDTTRAYVKLNSWEYEFIDIPGHKELIKNMLSGAADAAYGILVLDAEEGMRHQTVRHLKIARFLGIKKIIAVINKLDKVGYSSERFLTLKTELEKIMKNVGFKYRKNIVLPLMAFRGENLLKKSKNLFWFKGPTLKSAILNNFKTQRPDKNNKIKICYSGKKVNASCVFIKPPPEGSGLICESYFGKSRVTNIQPGKPQLNMPLNFSFRLLNPLKLTYKFVLKKQEAIIALCRFGN